jgi:hypothetical protein
MNITAWIEVDIGDDDDPSVVVKKVEQSIRTALYRKFDEVEVNAEVDE